MFQSNRRTTNQPPGCQQVGQAPLPATWCIPIPDASCGHVLSRHIYAATDHNLHKKKPCTRLTCKLQMRSWQHGGSAFLTKDEAAAVAEPKQQQQCCIAVDDV